MKKWWNVPRMYYIEGKSSVYIKLSQKFDFLTSTTNRIMDVIQPSKPSKFDPDGSFWKIKIFKFKQKTYIIFILI